MTICDLSKKITCSSIILGMPPKADYWKYFNVVGVVAYCLIAECKQPNVSLGALPKPGEKKRICEYWVNMTYIIILKGSFTIFLFFVRTHILNSNGLWYSWFWSEGPINAPNSRFLGFYFVPRDLDSRRHMGPRLAAPRTSTSGAGDLDSQRHVTLTQIYGAASQGPLRCELRSPAPRVEVPCGAGSRGPLGQNNKTKILSLRRL